MKWFRTLLGFRPYLLVIAYRDNPDVPVIETFKSREAMTAWVSANIPHDEPPRSWMYFWEYAWTNGQYRCISVGEHK